MGLEDPFDLRRVGNIRTALVMHNEIKSFGVVGVAKNRQRRMGAGVIIIKELDGDIGSLLNAFFQDIFLMRVIMAATTGNEQHAQGRWRSERPTNHAEGEETAQERGGFVFAMHLVFLS
jgi:hypothetical protein